MEHFSATLLAYFWCTSYNPDVGSHFKEQKEPQDSPAGQSVEASFLRAKSALAFYSLLFWLGGHSRLPQKHSGLPSVCEGMSWTAEKSLVKDRITIGHNVYKCTSKIHLIIRHYIWNCLFIFNIFEPFCKLSWEMICNLPLFHNVHWNHPDIC